MTILKTPSQIAQDYRTYLKNVKPSLNVDQDDSDWWIRSAVIGGVVAGAYADNLLISNDAFPQQARREAVEQHLQTYFGNDPVLGNFLPATSSKGFVAVTGLPGQVVELNLQATYPQNGNVYQVSENTTLDAVAGTGNVPFVSVGIGQSQNLQPGAVLTIKSPPEGINPTALVATGGLSDATDPETIQAARERILARIQNGFGVGRESDYIALAKAADPSVTSASVFRFIKGFGTLGVFITSGTTDIDTAINNGEAISVIPSQALIDEVQAYLNTNSPDTDMVYVYPPSTKVVNVTVDCKFSSGDGSTIISGQSITQAQLVQREVQRAIYKTPAGGRKIGNSGFMFLSDIQQQVDIVLSSEAFETGTIPILLDRKIYPLSVSGDNLGMNVFEVAIPGTITVNSI